MTFDAASPTKRLVFRSLVRGFMRRCPNCAGGNIFAGYTRVAGNCDNCGEDFHHQRADDAPPYFTIMIVGHIVVPGVLIVERGWAPETWVHMVIWMPLTLALTLAILPLVKGAIVALQWSLRMHGFGDEDALT
jgi:uncharacterized protein (DUF983 family)